jgi:hypothetical protein
VAVKKERKKERKAREQKKQLQCMIAGAAGDGKHGNG